jgi:hypothetical protein
MPLDIENVRKRVGIRNWQTAKAILFELLAQGRVSAVKTSGSWVFWEESTPWFKSLLSPAGPRIREASSGT